MNQPKILVVDDDKEIVGAIKKRLEMEDYEIITAYDGLEAMDILMEQEVQLLIIDVMMPKMDGWQVCREIRVNSKVPIIMLTARDSESDQVIGLEIGADEYVTKPFSPLTLIARIKAMHRRAKVDHAQAQATDDFDVLTDHVKISTITREAYLDGKQIESLTPKEFELFALLAEHPKQVFSREHLLTRIWEDPYYGDERTIDAHIKKLRQKIEAVGPQVIQTVWGVGYKFDDSGVEDK